MDVSQLHWSPLEYSLPDFAHRFQNFLPMVVKVTAGFLGKQELDSISRDTVIQVHSLQSQKRAVLEAKSGRILSIPVSIASVLFYVVKQNCQCDGPLSLQAVLSSHSLPVVVQPVTPLRLPASFATCYGNQLQTLTLSITYEEKFLLGHPLDMTGSLLTQTPLVLPMYMKEVCVSLAEQLNPQQQEQFFSNCAAQESVIESLSHNHHFIFQDITFLEKCQLIENGGIYTEVEPIYMNLDVQEESIALYQHLVDFSPLQNPPKPPVPLRKAKPSL
ncbi:uncharacterized protein LOC125706640 isoform X2 [Brienomyrus brachyistius]|nr:uncharacterized protein LOC125706640 isoform X2 [Brienomyrus brachyistius]XP_048829356.1 uncharacterized protein LOC125706640 isoform X2 [Brienomyrus brachyistius]